MPVYDPLEQALAQLRAITAQPAPQPSNIDMPDEYIPSQAGPAPIPQPMPAPQGFTQLPSEVERKQLLEQDGLMAELQPPAPSQDFAVPQPAALDEPPSLMEETHGRVAEAGPVYSPIDPSMSPEDALSRAGRADYAARTKRDEASRSHLQGVADAMQRGADDQAQATADYQRAMASANAAADMDNANWLTSMSELAKQEPNPGRWWDSQSGLGKALWAMSMVFGGAKVAITPGAKNIAMQMVNDEIDRDIRLQQARLKQEMAVGELKGTVMRDKHARNRSDQADFYSQKMSRIQALQRAWEAKAQVPGQLDADATKLESMAWFAGKQAEVAEQRNQEKRQATAAAIQRGHQAHQARLAREHDTREAQLKRDFDKQEHELNRQLTRDMGMISMSAKGPRTNAQGAPVDENNIPLFRNPASGVGASKTSGAVAVDANDRPINGTGVLNFRKEDSKQAEEFSATAEGANRRFRAMTRLHEVLADQGRVSAFIAGTTDPEITALITQMGTEGAKADDPGGRYTNQDFSRGISGRMGFDANGNMLDRAKFAANIPEIRKNLSNQIARMPKEVSQALSKTVDWSINGGASNRVIWSPVDLNADKVQQRSQDDIEGVTTLPEPVKSRKDYLNRAAAETANRARKGQLLPDHDQSVVQTALSLGRDNDGKIARAPKSIEKQAQDLLKELDKQEKAIQARSSERPEAIWDRGGDPRSGPTEEEVQTLQRIQNTKALVKTITDEDISAAAEKMRRIEGDIRVWSKFRSDEDIRKEVSRKHGMQGSPREIDELIKKAKKMNPTPLDFLPKKD